MSFTTVPTVSNGDAWSAAQHNTYLRDNMAALWPYTTAGDIAYASAANQLSRLGKPSVDSVLQNTSGGVLSWVAKTQLKGLLHAHTELDFYPNGQTTTSTSFVDVTGGTVNVVTTVTCTIVMLSYGMIASGSAGIATHVRGSIDGVADTPTSSANSLPYTTQGYYVPYSYMFRRIGVPAGTLTCKMQFRSGNAANTAYYDGGAIIALAFVD